MAISDAKDACIIVAAGMMIMKESQMDARFAARNRAILDETLALRRVSSIFTEAGSRRTKGFGRALRAAWPCKTDNWRR
jgi:hypothetical protein